MAYWSSWETQLVLAVAAVVGDFVEADVDIAVGVEVEVESYYPLVVAVDNSFETGLVFSQIFCHRHCYCYWHCYIFYCNYWRCCCCCWCCWSCSHYTRER